MFTEIAACAALQSAETHQAMGGNTVMELADNNAQIAIYFQAGWLFPRRLRRYYPAGLSALTPLTDGIIPGILFGSQREQRNPHHLRRPNADGGQVLLTMDEAAIVAKTRAGR